MGNGGIFRPLPLGRKIKKFGFVGILYEQINIFVQLRCLGQGASKKPPLFYGESLRPMSSLLYHQPAAIVKPHLSRAIIFVKPKPDSGQNESPVLPPTPGESVAIPCDREKE